MWGPRRRLSCFPYSKLPSTTWLPLRLSTLFFNSPLSLTCPIITLLVLYFPHFNDINSFMLWVVHGKKCMVVDSYIFITNSPRAQMSTFRHHVTMIIRHLYECMFSSSYFLERFCMNAPWINQIHCSRYYLLTISV